MARAPYSAGLGIALILLTASCAPKQGQTTYDASEVGVSRAVEFGTVSNIREVKLTNENSGGGSLAGAAAGGLAGGQIGNGSGNAWAAVGGVIAGAIIGHVVEENLRDTNGYEYILTMQSGEIKTIVQRKIEGDQVFKPGDKIMLQYCDAGEHNKKCAAGSEFQRLLPVAQFPPYVPKNTKH